MHSVSIPTAILYERYSVSKIISQELFPFQFCGLFNLFSLAQISNRKAAGRVREAYMTKETGLQTRHTEEALRLSRNMSGRSVKVAGIVLTGLGNL